MYQALVMTIAFQICPEVAIRDISDFALAFTFKSIDEVNTFVEELANFENSLQFSQLELTVLVTFAED
ncbi:MAG: hypothetical protein ACRDBG_04565 [Waterburya sp.]